jgi:hypothetical protein
MAVTNFIQTIWSKKIQDDLELKCKLVDNCLRDYEGDVKHAQSVKILGVGEPTIGAYDGTKDITIEEMSDRGQVLTIDQANYFAFYVDDVNQAQSVPGLAEKYQQKAVHGLAVKRDSYIANLIKVANHAPTKDTTVTSGKTYYTKTNETTFATVTPASGANPAALGYYETVATHVTTATNLTQEAVKDAIDKAIVALRERNFDEEGVIEITPAVYNVFKNCLITLSTNNPELIRKGVVGKYDDFDVIMSNNMAKDATHAYCDIRGKKAIAFAGQINEVEALRAEKRFKDIIRGLDTFGAKTIDVARIQVVKVPLVATA